MNMLAGIDVSKWQGKIDWKAVAKSGKVFYAFCKATEATGYKDPTFDANWKGIKDVGLARGAYHFARPDMDKDDAIKEADNFLKVVGPVELGDMLVLDIEEAINVKNGEQFYMWVLTFLERVKSKTGVIPIVYSGGPFFNEHAGKVSVEIAKKLSAYPFWLAAYVNSPDKYVPEIWKNVGWTFWQKSGDVAAPGNSIFKVEGTSGPIDYNMFKGSLEDLKNFTDSLHPGLKVEPPKVEEPKVEVPKVEIPKVEEPKVEVPVPAPILVPDVVEVKPEPNIDDEIDAFFPRTSDNDTGNLSMTENKSNILTIIFEFIKMIIEFFSKIKPTK